jgi:chromate transporter
MAKITFASENRTPAPAGGKTQDSSNASADIASQSDAHALTQPASLGELFTTFTWLALQSFGSVLAASQRMLCEQKRWLSSQQYVEVLAMAQVLPGPNACNLALIIGERYYGWRGAFVALAGILAVPLVLVLGLTILYAQFALEPAVAGALRGMSAVAAGLIIGTGLSLAHTLRDNAMRTPACVLTGAATFAAVALLHWPVWISLGIAALASVFAWHRVGVSAPAEEGSPP